MRLVDGQAFNIPLDEAVGPLHLTKVDKPGLLPMQLQSVDVHTSTSLLAGWWLPASQWLQRQHCTALLMLLLVKVHCIALAG